ncbi:ribonuclease P protein component [Planctomicrobium sp. SH664]|uniref:ribonuclease P protein component n=1 Tax=Planctomicrobium sp. SH664 TaxID=3448125 RepID=UPI003F5B8828
MNHPPSSDKSRFHFSRTRRIGSRFDFEKIYAHKQRVSDPSLLIFVMKNELGRTRIGVSVSRKCGNSVVRHRQRRLLKEAYRLEQHALPEGYDLILIPGREFRAAGVDRYRRSLRRLLRRFQATPAAADVRSDANRDSATGGESLTV